MLTMGGTKGGCNALAWILKTRAGMATHAALCLARIGTEDALNALALVLNDPVLSETVRVAAGAAMLHLGGEEALNTFYAQKGEAAMTLKNRPNRTITNARFAKLRKYITQYQNRWNQ
jgi:hypothetical protein